MNTCTSIVDSGAYSKLKPFKELTADERATLARQFPGLKRARQAIYSRPVSRSLQLLRKCRQDVPERQSKILNIHRSTLQSKARRLAP